VHQALLLPSLSDDVALFCDGALTEEQTAGLVAAGVAIHAEIQTALSLAAGSGARAAYALNASLITEPSRMAHR